MTTQRQRDEWKAVKICPMCGEPARKTYGRYCSKPCMVRARTQAARSAARIREIAQLNEEARALGLSYGQYVARRGIR